MEAGQIMTKTIPCSLCHFHTKTWQDDGWGFELDYVLWVQACVREEHLCTSKFDFGHKIQRNPQEMRLWQTKKLFRFLLRKQLASTTSLHQL